MKQYLIKAKIRDKPEGRNRIRKHIFAVDQEGALQKFRNIYDQPDMIDFDQVEFQSIEEIKEAK